MPSSPEGVPVYVRGTGHSVPIVPLSFRPSSLASFGSSPASSSDDSLTSSSSTSSSASSADSDFFATSSIPAPPSYSTIYPPSPPSSAPSSPSSQTDIGSNGKAYINPFHKALSSPSTPIKPLLTPHSSDSDVRSAPASILTAVFAASSPIHQLPSTNVDLTELHPMWKGAVLENERAGTKTLYVSGGRYEDVNLRESVCGVLELAEEELECNGVVMCLEKNTPDLGDLLHSLMYVGGTITTLPFPANPAYILVGLDL